MNPVLAGLRRHLPVLGAIALVLGAASSPAMAAETWAGKIRCTIIPGLTTKPLINDFVLKLDGARISYSKTVLVPDTTANSGVTETGSGTISGRDVTLGGDVTATGYHYSARYQGRLQGNDTVLTGEQVWTARGIAPAYPQPFHRACTVTLSQQ